MSRFFISIFFVLLNFQSFAQTAGEVLKLEEVAKFSIDDIKKIKAQLGIKTPTTSAVTASKLSYYTTSVDGQIVIATAAVAIPDNEPVETRAVVSYQHGTTTERNKAPSSGNFEFLLTGAIWASNGHVVVAADYLGLGDDPSFHPYLHAETEASACANALIAIYNLKLSTSKKLFLTGYSQGGHATMALHRYWQEKHGSFPAVTASAPMAGPYDLSGSVIFTAQDDVKISNSSVTYTGFLLLSMNLVYQTDPELKNSVKSPYLEKLPTLYAGNTSSRDIAAQLPKTLKDFLQAPFIESVKNSAADNAFLSALRKNDVYDWKSEAPIQFCQGDADLDVPPANTDIAMRRMAELGTVVTKANIPSGLTHGTAVTPCLNEAAKFFQGFGK